MACTLATARYAQFMMSIENSPSSQRVEPCVSDVMPAEEQGGLK
jgi:hypothetical protein